jgi:cobalt/nickel transport system permease protein
MHIPDGYLSPSTCAVLYAGAAPLWFIALKRVQRLLHTKMVPLLSVFAAFSFVIMMFNLPLPGGTTGHAAGMGISAIVLGPWGSIVAVSVALLIQALFFGDGGITAFGANCFNIAIVGSLVAYFVYRAIAGKTAVTDKRRVWAAGFAGYAALNIAALLTAIEFGLQPEFFKDATGAPLYSPYPLHIAIPAMMIGHLSFAGLAEAIISGGVVAYLQRANPALLSLTAREAQAGSTPDARTGGWRAARPLWIGLTALMLLCPLGLLVAGTAWGEWSPDDFRDPASRTEMTLASRDAAPPPHPPQGLEKLSALWTAPIPDYAPPFLKSEALGYVLSAFFGTGLILGVLLLWSALSQRIGAGREYS